MTQSRQLDDRPSEIPLYLERLTQESFGDGESLRRVLLIENALRLQEQVIGLGIDLIRVGRRTEQGDL